MKRLPLIGITMGDPAGIGPEVILKAIFLYKIYEECRPIVIGDRKVLETTMETCEISGEIKEVEDPDIPSESNTLFLINLNNVPMDAFKPGVPSSKCGRAAVEYIEKAVELVMAGKIDAITTAPINKEIINAAGYSFPGHTEMLARLAGVEESTMMMTGGGLHVVLVTTHMALRDVPANITKDRVLRTIRVTNESMKRYFHIPEPRIGLSALNPHAGEGKLFGTEEWDEIMPAVFEARGEGINVSDPVPADTLFYKTREGYYDVAIAMYHDQGLVPVKTLSFGKAVNVTLGLPFIRTSVDHGTAYDIAGKNCADPGSLIEAIRLVIKMATGGKHV